LKTYRVLNLISIRWYNACAQYALSIARALNQEGSELYFAGCPGSPAITRAGEEGFTEIPDINLASSNPLVFLLSVQRLKQFCREKGIQVVFSHSGPDHLAGALIKIALSGLCYHIDVRADIRRPKNHFLNRFLYCRGSDRHLVPSRFMRAYFTDFGIAPEAVDYLPPCINTDHFRPRTAPSVLRQQLGLTDTDILFGVVARLDPVKGHSVVMEAANRLSERRDIHFLISGDTFSVRPEGLRLLLNEKAKKQVHFLNRVPDVRPLLQALDVGLISSIGSEAICRIGLEMAAAGLPIIGTRVNSIPEMIDDEKGGLLIPPGESQALAQAVLRLSDDPSLRKKMGDYSLTRVQHEFGIQRFRERLILLVRSRP